MRAPWGFGSRLGGHGDGRPPRRRPAARRRPGWNVRRISRERARDRRRRRRAQILLVDSAVVDEEAAFPEPMSAEVGTHPAMSAAIAASGGRVADVGTTLAVTTSDALAARLGRVSGALVEHLEAFAVTTACAARGVPFACVLGVANAVGSLGREQWRSHHAVAAQAAGSFVRAGSRPGRPAFPTLKRDPEGGGGGDREPLHGDVGRVERPRGCSDRRRRARVRRGRA